MGTGQTLTPAGAVNDGNGGNNYSVTLEHQRRDQPLAMTVTAATDSKTYDGTIERGGDADDHGGQPAGGDTADLDGDLRHQERGHGQDADAGGRGERRQQRQQLHRDLRRRHHRRDQRRADHGDGGQPTARPTTAAPPRRPRRRSSGAGGRRQGNFTQTFGTKHVGTGKTLTPTGAVNDGNGGNNYSVTFRTTGAISPRVITVTAVTDSKPYDGTTNSTGVPTVTSGSLASGDTGNFTQSFGDKHVGTGKTITPTGSVNDGNGGNNYGVTFKTASGTINPLAVTVSAVSDSKTYDVQHEFDGKAPTPSRPP